MRYAILGLAVAFAAHASEAEALRISHQVQAAHMPFGTVVDPVYFSPTSNELAGYSRCGDSAIWTGHYLGAEAFRYAVTQSPEALDNMRRTVAGIQSLLDITGTDVLARCLVPTDSPYAPGVLAEESHNGIYTATRQGRSYYWIGNTSRDQYSGVFFGLSLAWDAVPDPAFRESIRALVARMLDYLERNDWYVYLPDGRLGTLFLGRFDQHLAFLAVGRQVDPGRYGHAYRSYRLWHSFLVEAPIAIDLVDVNDSYFKFNLDTINLYTLIRLEDDSTFRDLFLDAYGLMRRTTDNHGNAHFNMIDRSLRGPDAGRDEETRRLLESWLKRPHRDDLVDLRGLVPACGQWACRQIPVEQRVTTDFLWQRSPYQLVGGGQGTIEGAGIDYILPYWMARYYHVTVE